MGPGVAPEAQEHASPVIGQFIGASGQVPEVPCSELALVKSGEHDTVHQFGPELLHQVQGKGRFAGPDAMQEADVGVERDLFECAMHRDSEEPVPE